MGYFRDTVKGISWMGALRGSTRVVAFLKLAILARLLSPAQFGIFGIASLVLSFLEIITETGINIFLIQEDRDLEEYNDTAWVVSIIRGTIISLVLLALSPFMSSFFKSPEALTALLLIATVPFIRGFINPAIVKFQKDLEFSKEFVFRFSIFLADAIFAILVAFITHSALSLVWGMLAGSLLEVIISHTFIKPHPKLRLEKEKISNVVRRGKWVTAAGIFNYLFQEGDDIVVGRLMETTSLGFYQMAYKICTLPITEVADVVIKVTFPVYVKISQEAERLKKAYLKTLLGVSILVIPSGFLFLFFSDDIVRALLGESWLAIVPVVKVLSFFGVLRAITATTYPLLLALKKQEYVTAVTLIGILGLAVGIIPLVKSYGMIGAGIAALIGASLAVPAAFIFSYVSIRRLK